MPDEKHQPIHKETGVAEPLPQEGSPAGKKPGAASLLDEQDPNTRAYFDSYASSEEKAQVWHLRLEGAEQTMGPEVELEDSLPDDRTGANTYLPMGCSYPVSLFVLLDADPAARAYLAQQPQEVQQAALAANLQTAEELEHFVKKLENRLEGRRDPQDDRG